MIEKDTFEPKILEFTFGPDNTRAVKYYPQFYNEMFNLLFFDKSPEECQVERLL